MTLQDVVEIVETLSRKEQAELMHILVDKIAENDSDEKHKNSLSALRGLGAENWENISVDEYIRKLRDEWDHRP